MIRLYPLCLFCLLIPAAAGALVTSGTTPGGLYYEERGSGEPVVLIHDVWCRPCMLRECPIDHRCMRGITVDRVLAAARQAT